MSAASTPAESFLADHFLIAMPSLADPNFARGVTLLCQHDQGGAMGLTINRRSNFVLGEILSQMGIQTKLAEVASQPVLLGGPVQPDHGFVLHDDPRDWGSTLRFGHGLAITTSRDVLEAMARGAGPARAIVALGFAGWGAGQLEAELSDNAWLTGPVDPAIVFGMPLESRWRAAADSIGVDMTRLSDAVGHA
jgi:putative transcriptional regulator